MDTELLNSLRDAIREIPDFPKPGIMFYDITTLLKNGQLFSRVIELIAERHLDPAPDVVVGIESRGLILGGAVAHELGLGFVPVRKLGKLPAAVERAQYSLEYGYDSVEVHRDGIKPGSRVIVVDDVLATGGTASATVELIHRLGGTVVECLFLIELRSLGGRTKLGSVPVFSILSYDK